MKIGKFPKGAIYDTDNPNYFEYVDTPNQYNVPLHHSHNKTDIEYLKQYFKEDHPIFNNFGESYFYVQSNEKRAGTLKQKFTDHNGNTIWYEG